MSPLDTARLAPLAIELAGATRVYGLGGPEQVRALDGVDLAIERGGFTAIMGPSGSGKSTMLNVLGCLDRLTSGGYRLGGQDVRAMHDAALSRLRLGTLGFVFQSFNLLQQLSVRENIETPLFYRGWPKRRRAERAEELAVRVGLGDRLGHRPSELSGGQRQRVAIARALAGEPSVLLADEPTGALDTATGKAIMAILREANERGVTIVLVTHEREVADHAPRVVHMRDGRIERIDGAGPVVAAACAAGGRGS